MKYAATIALIGFAFVPSSAQFANETEQELTKILRNYATARMTGDVAFLEKLYAKEFRITGTDGSLIERDTDIALFANGQIKPQSIEDDDLKVSIYCTDVAIVTGRETLKGTYKGNYGEGSLRFTTLMRFSVRPSAKPAADLPAEISFLSVLAGIPRANEPS
jgi:hypothetical protein